MFVWLLFKADTRRKTLGRMCSANPGKPFATGVHATVGNAGLLSWEDGAEVSI